MDGYFQFEFNQPLLVPPFDLSTQAKKVSDEVVNYDWKNRGHDKPEDWAMENIMGLSNAKKKIIRKLLNYKELNVTRDVMDFDYLLKSSIEKANIAYDLIITEWTSTGMTIFCNFSKPLDVSVGILPDQLKFNIFNRFLFVSKDSGKILR